VPALRRRQACRQTRIEDLTTRNLKITLEYDGNRYVGWQRQAEGESIQGLLEDALAKFEGGPVTAHGAGRTDAGVHALGQVASAHVSFTHPPATIGRGLNATLPEDIRVIGVADMPEDFHARFSARSKTYRYQMSTDPIGDPFSRRLVWQLREQLDLETMARAAATLVGTHDFAAFQSAGTDVTTTVRTIVRSDIVMLPAGPPGAPARFAYDVTADGFLRHMVRAIVGTLVEIGRGRRDAESLAQLLDGGTRAQAGATAPPHGLFLVRVDYDEESP